MKRKPLMAVSVVLALVLFLGGTALAMSSTNYRLDWYLIGSGSGGGHSSSTQYAADLTVGQTTVGSSTSASYIAGLGYWSGLPYYYLYMPVIQRTSTQ